MRRLYFSLGKNKFWEYVLLALFLLFFYGPLMNMLLLSFAGDYEYPDVIPRSYGFKWWDYVLSKAQLVQSIGTSLVLAVVVTLLSLAVCLPAAYALARYPFRGRSAVRLSFLLTNAFPKMGIYTAMAVIFYKLNLIGTFAGVVLVHIVNTMMFMVWIPSGAFRTVHIQQEESARDVGASPLRTFLMVMVGDSMFIPSADDVRIILPKFKGQRRLFHTHAAFLTPFFFLEPAIVSLVLSALHLAISPRRISHRSR